MARRSRRRSYRMHRLGASNLGFYGSGISWGTLAVGAAAGYGIAVLMKKDEPKKDAASTAAAATGSGAVSGLGYFGAMPAPGSDEARIVKYTAQDIALPARAAARGERRTQKLSFPAYVVGPLEEVYSAYLSYYNPPQYRGRMLFTPSAQAAAERQFIKSGVAAYLALVSWYSTLSPQQKMMIKLQSSDRWLDRLERTIANGFPARFASF